MTKEQLIDAGFRPLTVEYHMPKEDEMFSRALKQLEKGMGGDPHYILWNEDRTTAEIWSLKSYPDDDDLDPVPMAF